MAGFGLEQDLQARAVIRRMAVVLLVFEIVMPVGLMLDLVLAVMAEGVRAGALGFLGLLTGIALGQPDPGPDRILDAAALELCPDRGSLCRCPASLPGGGCKLFWKNRKKAIYRG